MPGARLSNASRAPRVAALRAERIANSGRFFAGGAGLLGACSCFSNTLLGTKRDHQRKDPCEEGDREREADPISPGLRPHTQDVGPNDAGAREQEKPGVRRTHLVLLSQDLDDKTGAQVFPSAIDSDVTR